MFKKSLSVILALLMLVSCMSTMVFSAGAETYSPVGTGIASLDDITDMEGSYYLTADISVSETFAETFKGTIDGKDTNGNIHTITASVPVFKTLGAGATVKNLKLAGTITTTATTVGTLAASTDISTEKIITLSNVTNNAVITVTAAGITKIGGIIGEIKCTVSATDCVNNGAITVTKGASACTHNYTGGIVGYASTDASASANTFIRCTNGATASISATNCGTTWIAVGGILGFEQSTKDVVFEACVNNAALEATSEKNTLWVAGIIGCNFSTTFHRYIGCVNNGALKGQYEIGGIVARDNGIPYFKSCKNTGSITFKSNYNMPTADAYAYGGGMLGNLFNNKALSSKNVFFEDCINEGAVKAENRHNTCLIGGLLGYVQSASTNVASISFVRCTNTGDITVNDKTTSGGKPGGIVAVMDKASTALTFVGCVNRGTVTGASNVGGICGQSSSNNTKFVACVNYGQISASSTKCTGNFAGIAGYIVTAKFYNCVNNGNVSTGDDDNASGITEYVKTKAEIVNCENYGTVTGKVVNSISGKGTQTGCNDYMTDPANAVTVSFEGVQRSVAAADETTFNLRFVSKITDIEKYKATGIIVYRIEEGKTGVSYTDSNTTTVYKQIIGMENGVNTAYPAVTAENTYYSALTVTDIKVAGTYSFVVVPYTVALDSTYAYAAAYSITVINGVISTPVAVAPNAN